MKYSSPKANRARRLATFSFFALSILLIVSSLRLAAADKMAQAGWRVEIEEGKSKRSTLTINNRCSTPHLFRIKSGVKYLHFEQPTDSVLIDANSSKQLEVRFDATGLRSKTYRGKVIIDCLDCKQGPGCKQDRDELAVEMIVIKPSVEGVSTKPAQSDEGSFTLTRLKDGFSAKYIFSQKTIFTELRREGNRSVVSVREASLGGILNMEIPSTFPSFSSKEAFEHAGRFVVEDGLRRAPPKDQVLLLTTIARSSGMIARELEGKESESTLLAVQALPKFLGIRLERSGANVSGANDTVDMIVIGPNDGVCNGACGIKCDWCFCRGRWCLCEVNLFCILHDACCHAVPDFWDCFPCHWSCWIC